MAPYLFRSLFDHHFEVRYNGDLLSILVWSNSVPYQGNCVYWQGLHPFLFISLTSISTFWLLHLVSHVTILHFQCTTQLWSISCLMFCWRHRDHKCLWLIPYLPVLQVIFQNNIVLLRQPYSASLSLLYKTAFLFSIIKYLWYTFGVVIAISS